MKLVLNKNNIVFDNIKFINKNKYIKLVYDLNNVYMNGIFIRINEFKIYNNNNNYYLTLLNESDINIMDNIIKYINNNLNIKLPFCNNIIKIKNNISINKEYIDININNIKKFDKKYILFVYN